MNRKVIILGLSATAKYVAKECYDVGIYCVGIDRAKGAGYYSKYFSEKHILEESGCRAFLKDALRNSAIQLLVCPTTDEWIEFIAEESLFRDEDRLVTSQGYLDESHRTLGDKKELQMLCEKLDIAYPKSVICVGTEQPNVELDLTFPVFCKPTNRSGLSHIMKGSKGWVIQNRTDLLALLAQKDLAGIELIVQEIITGPESNIKVLATVAGTEAPSWVGAKVRQFPPDFGSGSLVVKEDIPVLSQIAQQLIQATAYQGFFALEVKLCPIRNRFYIIEVNPRPSLWFSATTHSRTDLVKHWLNTLIERPYTTSSVDTQTTIVWQYAYKDLAARLLARRKGKSQKWAYSRPFKKTYAVWDWRDPLPFMYDLWTGLSKFIKRSI